MADTNHLFTWDELKGNDTTAPKKLVTAFKRAGAEIAASWVAEKTKRENSITYREIGFTLADSQTIVLRVKQTGDIYQVRMNGKVLPMKEQELRGFDVYLRDYLSSLAIEMVGASTTFACLGLDSDYIAVFIPGGHGALIGLPYSAEVKAVLEWASAKDKFVISLCHGPAAFLAIRQGNKKP